MKCDNIVLFTIYTGNATQDTELANGAAAYRKKYAKVNLHEIGVSLETKDDAWQKAAIQQFEDIKIGIKGDKPEIGMYLLVHANEATTCPPAEKIAEVVGQFINNGTYFQKINIMGCRGAGDDPKTDVINSSALGTFCKCLRLKVSGQLRAGMDRLAVCGYQGITATYDPTNDYHRKTYKDVKSSDPDWQPGDKTQAIEKSRTLLLNLKDKSYYTTHPMSVKPDYLKECKEFPSTLEQKCEEFIKGKKGLTPAQKKGKFDDAFGKSVQALFDKNPILNAMWQYMKMKKVLVYDAKTDQFILGSLTQYTNNETIGQLVTVTNILRRDGGTVQTEKAVTITT